MRGAGLLLIPLFVLGTMIPGATPSLAEPSISVNPTTGLAGGDPVTVRATGLSPGADVRVIQCDQFNDDLDYDCADVTSVVADDNGGMELTVTLTDPVYRSQPFGDGIPVYCRADICRIFLVWTDSAGSTQVLSSVPLRFVGSPATVTAAPTTNLRKKQWVRVAGTAHGARGRTVTVVEEACFAMIQGSGCYGTLVLGSSTIRTDGTWSFKKVRVRRFLADGTDCADTNNILGVCQLTARILDASAQPDDSFGVARIGDPGVELSFRTRAPRGSK